MAGLERRSRLRDGSRFGGPSAPGDTHRIDPRYAAAARSPSADFVRALMELAPQMAVEMLPGAGDAAAMRDSVKSGGDMVESFKGGDYGKAGSDAVSALAAGLGALPSVPHLGGVVKAYHGTVTKHPIEKFEWKDRHGKNQPVWFSPEAHKEFTNGFSTGDQGRVYPVEIDTDDFLDTRKPAHKKAFEQLLHDNDKDHWFVKGYAKKEEGEPDLPGWDDNLVLDMVRDAGYPGVIIQERPWMESIAVFDGSKVKSQFEAKGKNTFAPITEKGERKN